MTFNLNVLNSQRVEYYNLRNLLLLHVYGRCRTSGLKYLEQN